MTEPAYPSKAFQSTIEAIADLQRKQLEVFARGTGLGLQSSGLSLLIAGFVAKFISGSPLLQFTYGDFSFAVTLATAAVLIVAGAGIKVYEYQQGIVLERRLLDIAIERERNALAAGTAVVAGVQESPQRVA